MALLAVKEPETPCKYAEKYVVPKYEHWQPHVKLGRNCRLQPNLLCFSWNKPEAVATCQVRIDHEKKDSLKESKR